MNQVLFDILTERLTGDSTLDARVTNVIFAACQGRAELKACLSGGESSTGDWRRPDTHAPETAGAYLTSLKVGGFRGIGAPVQLNFREGPGLTLVIGRNGTGKSSFAEGLELLLTGDTLRWSGKAQIWSQCWRNLHQTDQTILEAEFLVEGQPSPVKLHRSWSSGTNLEAGRTVVRRSGQAEVGLADIGWSQALQIHRPILSYNEMGSMFSEGPSKLHDALSVILGLDDLVSVAQALKEERSSRESAVKEVSQNLAALRYRLEPLRDERASKCREALSKKTPDLDKLGDILVGLPEQNPESHVALLRELCSLTPPTPEEAQAVATRLDQLQQRQRALAGSDAERAWQTAELLDAALRFHQGHPEADHCPVCASQRKLDSDWAEATRAEVNRLKALAEEAKSLRLERESALSAARNLLREVPGCLRRAAEVGIDTSTALQCWTDYGSGPTPEDLTALSSHLVGGRLLALIDALQKLKTQAAQELDVRQSEWREIHGPLTAFLTDAKKARRLEPDVKMLKQAETWLKEASDEIRAARFRPIGQAAQKHWDMLRQDSNVELGGVMLAGTGTKRRVSMDVSVDGVQGAALSVMSQGELNALALSLFLPRATLEESTFRFVVIDDPVQSMDPARVDGLARTLEKVAQNRQVVVFTHDARLEEAVRRMGISADILELTRRENSVVEVRTALDPVRRALEDAAALAKTPDLDPRAAARAIPGFCRIALEAAFDQVVRRGLLSKGHKHREVEDSLENARTLRQKASLALFNTTERTNVEDELARRGGQEAVKAFQLCNKGAHGQLLDDPMRLVQATKDLVRRIEAR